MTIKSIKWSEELATGVTELDNQHKEIISRIDAILTMSSESSEEEIEETLKFFGGYMIEHFETEERFMVKYKYPEYDFHKSEHMKFLKEFSLLKRQLKKDHEFSLLPIVVGTKSQTADWIIKHIMSEDRPLANFLKKKMAKYYEDLKVGF